MHPISTMLRRRRYVGQCAIVISLICIFLVFVINQQMLTTIQECELEDHRAGTVDSECQVSIKPTICNDTNNETNNVNN